MVDTYIYTHFLYVYINIWAEVALGLYYKTFLIYRACMRRAPTRPARACFVRTCCVAVVQEHLTPSEHLLHTSHCALHTPIFTLHTCTSHSTFHLISNHVSSSHLISPHLSSSHLIPSLLTCHLSTFFSTVFISSEHWLTLLISSKFFLTPLSLSARQKALTVREKSLAQKTLGAESFCTQKLETQMRLHRKAFTKYFALRSLHKALPSTTLYYKACTK